MRSNAQIDFNVRRSEVDRTFLEAVPEWQRPEIPLFMTSQSSLIVGSAAQSWCRNERVPQILNRLPMTMQCFPVPGEGLRGEPLAHESTQQLDRN
jgi:hypothetical protein